MVMPYVVEARDAGAKLGVFLRRQGISLSLIRALKYQDRGICVNGERARTNQVLQGGDKVQLNLPEERGFSALPQAGAVEIVYESAHAMVLAKPAGQVMHPSPSHHEGTLANYYCGLMQARGTGGIFRPVGRLDGGTSGLVLCAMHAAVAPFLAKSMQKTYLALASGVPQRRCGAITAPLGPAPGSAILQQAGPDGRPSRTVYKVLTQGQDAFLAAVRPRTGRTHQIRAHFAHMGHPLLGDVLYGDDAAALPRHGLHCAWLDFTQPGGERVRLALPMPQDMADAARTMGVALEKLR